MILFFGPPGSGKSVQGELLVKANGWQWLSTGAMFRQSTDPEVLACLASGELINDELTDRVLDSALGKLETGFVVMDGYPRNVHQVRSLKGFLAKYGRKINCVVVFHVPRAELIKRLGGRGRAEDTPEVIGRRLDIYEESTKPVIACYEQDDVPVVHIDGLGTVEEVHNRIQDAVREYVRS